MSLWFVHHQECVVPHSILSYTYNKSGSAPIPRIQEAI